MLWKVAIISIAAAFFAIPVYAHPGNTDTSGCHTCRTRCEFWDLNEAEYHCHKAKIIPVETNKKTSRTTYFVGVGAAGGALVAGYRMFKS